MSAGGVKALQLYARKMIKERNKKGTTLTRPPKQYQKTERIQIERSTSFISPPPRYRPITPAALYEMEAVQWWPGTEQRPLSSGDAHHASSPDALNSVSHTRPTVATAAENVFFNGEKLAQPILPARSPQRAPTSPNPKAPMSAASASEHGAFQLQGRPAPGSAEAPRFYF